MVSEPSHCLVVLGALCSLAGRRTETLVLSACVFPNSAPWMDVRLSGLVKFSVVRHPGCYKEDMETVTLYLGVAHGPALRLQSCWLPMWARLASMHVEASWSVLPRSGLGPLSVGGCNPSVVGICELCGGSHGPVQKDTPEGACAHLGWAAFCLASLSVPRFLNLSLSLSSLVPCLPSCDGPAVGDVWTPSDITVCFSRLCSPGALVWPPPLGCGGPILSLEVASGQGSPHPMGAPSPLQCVSGLLAVVPRVGMEGAQQVTRGPTRRRKFSLKI